ncbi:Conserved_hypothetical protein [Hexamita inflata]|uniref:Protein of centriole 5 n=1 Tax=Hexamita inflata TaxID=28002 RepID=A0ABP1GEJ4_9EUKA
MDFIKSYSSILSKESSSDKNQQPLASKPPKDSQVKASTASAKTQNIQQSQNAQSANLQSNLQQSQALKASQLQQPDLNYQQFDSVKQSRASSFNQLVDDSIHAFRKSIAFAMEQGIQESLMLEKQTLVLQLKQFQERCAQLEAENQNVKLQNDKFQLELANSSIQKQKMCELISDLKTYRKDSLYGQRVLKAWSIVAKHGQKCVKYEAMLEDQRSYRQYKQIFNTWRITALQKQQAQLIENASGEIKKLHTEREEYFRVERNKYEKEINTLKNELGSFAVKERKMKDSMKQAFLKGINAISEEATCALDRAERIGMPVMLQRELEDQFVAKGGNVDNIRILSDEEDEFKDQPDGVDEFKGFTEQEQEQNVDVEAEKQFQTEQKRIIAGSPARKVGQHTIGSTNRGGSTRDNMNTIQSTMNQQMQNNIPRPEPKPQQRVMQITTKQVERQNEVNGNLASRLRNGTKVKQDPQSMIYKESLRAVHFKVEKE